MLALTACGGDGRDGPVRVSVAGAEKELVAPLTHIQSRAGQVMMAATAQGLVSYDAAGNVVPGLAQRWIVVDDGLSYIFRLRRAQWPDGSRVDARDVRRLLLMRMGDEVERDPYGVMASVSQVMAMTADVIEIRLTSPQPDFLLVLAQPEMGFLRQGGGTGPYRVKGNWPPKGNILPLALSLQLVHGAGAMVAEPAEKEQMVLRAERPAKAIARFKSGEADVFLGGTLAEFPYIALSEVPARSVRFDAVQGLFGLALSPKTPMFEDASVREALSMAIDRQAVVGMFDMNRWRIAEQLLPQQYNLPHLPSVPSWTRNSIEDRRNLAIGVIARWRAQHGDKPVELTIMLPEGPGMDLLFIALRQQLRAIGVDVRRVKGPADLSLIDEVAPYDSIAWYLGRLSCARKVHCDSKAEGILKQSGEATNLTDRLLLLGQAEPLIQGHHGFIPLAMPVRWSLVASRLNGFEPSARGDRSLRGLRR